MKHLKFIAYNILVLVVLFGICELLVYWFANQDSKTIFLTNDRAVEGDSERGYYTYIPNGKYRVKKPEFDVTYQINAEGLRDRNTYLDRPRDSTRVRIVVVGDSFSFGEGCEYDDCWHVMLENELQLDGRPVEIVKAGVSAYDQVMEFNYLREELLARYQPDIVMVGFLPNDLFTNAPIFNGPGAKKTGARLEDRGNIRAASRVFRVKSHFVNWLKARALGVDPIYVGLYENTDRGRYFQPMENLSKREQEKFLLTRDLFFQINDLTRQYGARLIVVSIPQLYQVLKQANDENYVNHIDTYFTEAANEDGFTWISTSSDFARHYRETGEVTHYRVDGHLNNTGNTVLKNSIVHYLKKQ